MGSVMSTWAGVRPVKENLHTPMVNKPQCHSAYKLALDTILHWTAKLRNLQVEKGHVMCPVVCEAGLQKQG